MRAVSVMGGVFTGITGLVIACSGSQPAPDAVPATSWTVAVQQEPLVCVTGHKADERPETEGIRVCLSRALTGETRISVDGQENPLGCLRVHSKQRGLGYATGADAACREFLEVVGEDNRASFHVGGTWPGAAKTGPEIAKALAAEAGAFDVQVYGEPCETSCRGAAGYRLIRFSEESGVQFVAQSPTSCGLLGSRGETRKPPPSGRAAPQTGSAPSAASSTTGPTSSSAPPTGSSSGASSSGTTPSATTTSGG